MWYRDVVSQRGILTQERGPQQLWNSELYLFRTIHLEEFNLNWEDYIASSGRGLNRFQCKIVIIQGKIQDRRIVLPGTIFRRALGFSALLILSSSWSREFTRSGMSSMRRSPCCWLRTLYRKAASSPGSVEPRWSSLQRRSWSTSKAHSCSR